MHDDSRHFAATATYAARVVNSNMSPRHEKGEYVLFETGDPPCAGDDVFIVFKDGTTVTWGLDAISDSELTVHGYNPPQTTTISRQLIREFYSISAWGMSDIDRFVD